MPGVSRLLQKGLVWMRLFFPKRQHLSKLFVTVWFLMIFQIPPDPCSNEPSQAEQQEITTMCISPSEETLATSTDRGQMYLIALASAEISKVP